MAALFLVTLFVVDPEDRDSPLETAFDLVVALILLAGMILFAAGVTAPGVVLAWKFVSVSLVAMVVISNVRARVLSLREEPAEGGDVAFADVLTLVLLLPSALINLWFAFGSS